MYTNYIMCKNLEFMNTLKIRLFVGNSKQIHNSRDVKMNLKKILK
jgi:hypothetical protein